MVFAFISQINKPHKILLQITNTTMNILDKIIVEKQKEIDQKKNIISIASYEQMPMFGFARKSLSQSLLKKDSTGIIAEFKRKSPSKGIINRNADIAKIAAAYSQHAAGISVLTDEPFFGGSNDDLITARGVVDVPLLRKDFIVDEYQLYEAKAIGADVILLIAACLSQQQVKQLAKTARELQLEVLLEIHNEEELDHICDEVTMIGVNNRNLKTFEVDINTSLNLITFLPKEKPTIAESGISNVKTIKTLRNAGFKGFLIGENFMKNNDPSIAFIQFVNELKQTT